MTAAQDVKRRRRRSLVGERVFFKRRAMQLLRGYWGRRWDSPTIREAVTLTYTPKYWVDAEHLDGLLLELRRVDLLWFRGLFSRGRHLPSGRYVQAPLTESLRGFGPRTLVFPKQILEHLVEVELIGGAPRYVRSASVDDEAREALTGASWATRAERLVLRVSRVFLGVPPPLTLGQGPWARERTFRHRVICLEGDAWNTPLEGREVVVPISEVRWNQFRQEGDPWW